MRLVTLWLKKEKYDRKKKNLSIDWNARSCYFPPFFVNLTKGAPRERLAFLAFAGKNVVFPIWIVVSHEYLAFNAFYLRPINDVNETFPLWFSYLLKTRPDTRPTRTTRQSSRGRLGSSNANSKMLRDWRTDGPTVPTWCRVVCPRLKNYKSLLYKKTV